MKTKLYIKSYLHDMWPWTNNNAAARQTEKLAEDPSPAPTGIFEVIFKFIDGGLLKKKCLLVPDIWKKGVITWQREAFQAFFSLYSYYQ